MFKWTISSVVDRVYKGVASQQKTVPTSQRPAKDVYGFCWKIGVKWRDLIDQISLQLEL